MPAENIKSICYGLWNVGGDGTERVAPVLSKFDPSQL